MGEGSSLGQSHCVGEGGDQSAQCHSSRGGDGGYCHRSRDTNRESVDDGRHRVGDRIRRRDGNSGLSTCQRFLLHPPQQGLPGNPETSTYSDWDWNRNHVGDKSRLRALLAVFHPAVPEVGPLVVVPSVSAVAVPDVDVLDVVAVALARTHVVPVGTVPVRVAPVGLVPVRVVPVGVGVVPPVVDDVAVGVVAVHAVVVPEYIGHALVRVGDGLCLAGQRPQVVRVAETICRDAVAGKPVHNAVHHVRHRLLQLKRSVQGTVAVAVVAPRANGILICPHNVGEQLLADALHFAEGVTNGSHVLGINGTGVLYQLDSHASRGRHGHESRVQVVIVHKRPGAPVLRALVPWKKGAHWCNLPE